MDRKQLDKLVTETEAIVESNFNSLEVTVRNHATIQSSLVTTNVELIKTIQDLDSKNSKLQKQLFWLSLIATFAAIVALFK